MIQVCNLLEALDNLLPSREPMQYYYEAINIRKSSTERGKQHLSQEMDIRKVKPCIKSEDSVKEYVRHTMRKCWIPSERSGFILLPGKEADIRSALFF